jgi:hypothetical protein
MTNQSEKQKADAQPATSQSTEPAATIGATMHDDAAALESSSAAPPAAPAVAEPLELPKGAMVVLRLSGGMKFSSHEVVVYPDGRVTLGGGDTAHDAYQRVSRRLLDAQIVRMRRALEQSGFFRMKAQTGSQPPDGYAYELVARVGNRFNRIEFFTGSVPNSLQPLIEQLTQLLPNA